jgi:hypothetical protein
MKLLLLRCPQCQSPLEPEQLDVIVGCRHCFTAIAIDEKGLRLHNVHYAASQFDKRRDPDVTEQWVPFWVFNGRVQISKRDTQGGSGSAQRDAEQFWDVPRRLYVPAWELPMPTARDIGQKFTQEQTRLQAVPQPPGAHLIAATVTPDDALKLMEFIVLSIEAQRKDWLKNLTFHISADAPELWALPAQLQGSRWLFYLAGK